MTPQEARKLLGGYATGTLTPAEQDALFAAALDDQELFDELAREQALRELIADPAAKATLLASLDERPRAGWQSWRPWAAVVAMAGVGVLAVWLRQPPAAPVEVARVDTARPPVVSLPAPEEAPPAPATQAPKRKAIPSRTAALPEAPKPEAMAKSEAPPAGGVVGGVVGGVPSTAPPPPPPKAEQAQVTAAAPSAGFQDAAARPQIQTFALRTGAAQPLALRYAILRDDNGVRIRFTAMAPGYLSVGGATPVTMVLMQPYTTPALTAEEVKVVFSRQPVADAPLGLVPNIQQRGGETYVANTAENEPLVFTIPLKQP